MVLSAWQGAGVPWLWPGEVGGRGGRRPSPAESQLTPEKQHLCDKLQWRRENPWSAGSLGSGGGEEGENRPDCLFGCNRLPPISVRAAQNDSCGQTGPESAGQ